MQQGDLFLLVLAIITFACKEEQEKPDLPVGAEVLQKSMAYHDPDGKWKTAELNLYIQEPRLKNPARYTLLRLNNADGTFELSRKRDDHISTHIIDSAGKPVVLLDGKQKIDSALIKKYRLDPQRNTGYRNFYRLMYGVPMSLDSSFIKTIGETTGEQFNGQEAYKVEVELHESMITKHWCLYFAQDTYQMLGMEMTDPQDSTKGERLIFDYEFETQGLRIPRIRHWHDRAGGKYEGSDIVIGELE